MIISNTTPFIALSSIQKLELLPQLFPEIHVSRSVHDECLEGGGIAVPDLSRLEWVKIHEDITDVKLPILLELDRGEKQTIALALNNPGSVALIDEKIGRNTAEYLGIQVSGTLGVLVKAKRLGLIDSFFQDAQRMTEAGIRYNSNLILRISTTLGE